MFELEGSQYKIDEWLQPVGTEVTQDELPTMVAAPLKIIFRTGQ
jgi:hypothetical protein